MSKKAPSKTFKVKKVEPIRRVITANHIFRRVNDKPDPREITLLEKAFYHEYKMMFREDTSGQSSITFGGLSVTTKTGTLDLKELFSKIVHTYSIL